MLARELLEVWHVCGLGAGVRLLQTQTPEEASLWGVRETQDPGWPSRGPQ